MEHQNSVSKRLTRLVRDAERLARQRLAVFVGGTCLLGLLILRILRKPPLQTRAIR
jgi:hypothetical protein